VILIGEMRDTETIATALTAAETGHLVFATLHTQDAPRRWTGSSTSSRAPAGPDPDPACRFPWRRSSPATRAERQRLRSHTPVAEVMICNPAIRNLIRSSKTHQIYSLIQTGAAAGMQTMDQGLARASKRAPSQNDGLRPLPRSERASRHMRQR